MAMASNRAEKRGLRRQRVRRIVRGTDERPRLSIYRSLHHIYVQVISDTSGRTLAAASTLGSGTVSNGLTSKRNLSAAKTIGKAIAEKCLASGIQSVIFDRNGFLYHGRVKALADAAREAGLKF
jgi:large subunit ribosomal protein L18